MSDKKRRDIALGDLKAGCKLTAQNDIKACDKCEFSAVCSDMGFGIAPAFWKLTDPPRFNEQQMAALKQSYDSGVTKIKKTENAIHYTIPDLGVEIVIINHSITSSMEVGETLDLAELLGKESNEK